MQDELDSVPADAIFFNEAFERVFDTWHPDAAMLRAAIEKTSVMTEQSLQKHDEAWALWNEAWRNWDKARSEAQKWFRDQLAMGVLDFYQRDRATGEKLRLRPDNFVSEYAFNSSSPDPLEPPVFFVKADFEKWLSGILGKKKKGSPAREQAEIAIKAIFGTLIPDPAEIRNGVLCQRVQDFMKQQKPPSTPISDDTILRAAGRKP